MTGITRVSKESIFPDLNNLKVVTTTSDKYADCFGFMEEVFAALDEYGMSEQKQLNNAFLQALLADDVKAMNTYMNKVTLEMFSYFDTGNRPSGEEPERFYHGFVLGLMVELADRYVITSNRESGFVRYDVMLEPRTPQHNAIVIEFKVQEEDEQELADTVQRALKQIMERNYKASFVAKGIPEERIRMYGFAFCGKKVRIGGAE
jgi:hypothetical protein